MPSAEVPIRGVFPGGVIGGATSDVSKVCFLRLRFENFRVFFLAPEEKSQNMFVVCFCHMFFGSQIFRAGAEKICICRSFF